VQGSSKRYQNTNPTKSRKEQRLLYSFQKFEISEVKKQAQERSIDKVANHSQIIKISIFALRHKTRKRYQNGNPLKIQKVER